MIRAAFLLTFAFTLGAGDSVTLVCQALCDQAASASTETCRHNASPPTRVTVTTGVDCAVAGLSATAVIRNDTQRPGLSTPDAGIVPVVTAPATPASEHALVASGASPALVHTPRTIALRI